MTIWYKLRFTYRTMNSSRWQTVAALKRECDWPAESANVQKKHQGRGKNRGQAQGTMWKLWGGWCKLSSLHCWSCKYALRCRNSEDLFRTFLQKAAFCLKMEDLNGTRSSFSTGWYHATMWRTSVAQPWIRALLRWAQCSYSLTRSAPCHFKALWRCLPWQLQNNQHVSYLKKKIKNHCQEWGHNKSKCSEVLVQ